MGIITLDDMITELEKAKVKHGGSSKIAIKDEDSGYHLEVAGIRESNNAGGRLLIVSSGYNSALER